MVCIQILCQLDFPSLVVFLLPPVNNIASRKPALVHMSALLWKPGLPRIFSSNIFQILDTKNG